MRPLLRWLLFAACIAVFTGAMLWISVRTLDLEKQRRQTAEDAQVQEKVRLALWRMDSLASALLIRENSRPAYHYQAFYAPDDLFANATQSIPKGQALMPSPLFASLPDLVQLHFEVVSGSTCSPQSPMGPQKEIASNWYATSPQSGQAAAKLKKLDELLKKHPEVQTLPELSSTPTLELKPEPPAEQKMKTAALKDQKMHPRGTNTYMAHTLHEL